MRQAIIHIGIGKTGSTTIQASLAANRRALLDQGFAYPASPGKRNHLKLAILAADTRDADQMLRATREATPAGLANRRFTEELAEEIAALPAHVHTLIFSNEHLATKVSTEAAAARLKAVLDRHCSSYRVIAYLRRQDEYAVSLYTTLLRSGSGEAEVLAPLRGAGQQHRLDFAAMLDRWGAVFGRDALVPRLFARDAFVGGDLLVDFRTAAGGIALPETPEAETRNPSNLPAAQELLRRLNRAARDAGDTDPDAAEAVEEGEAGAEFGKVPNAVRSFLDSRFAGPGRRPSRAEAEAFTAGFAASNQRVRDAFFPDRPSLFGDDFSRYPEVADPPPAAEGVLEVALALILAHRSESDEAAADIAFRRGRARAAAGDAVEARRLFHRALGKWPAHLPALRGLAELADTPDLREEAAGRARRALEVAPDRPELRGVLARLSRGETAGDDAIDPPVPGSGDGAADAARAARPAGRENQPGEGKARAKAKAQPGQDRPVRGDRATTPGTVPAAAPTATAAQAEHRARPTDAAQAERRAKPTEEERAARRAALSPEERAARKARRAEREARLAS